MSKLVRVKDPTTGAEYTTGTTNAKNRNLEVLDMPAVDVWGRALPATRREPAQPSGLSANSLRADLEQAARDIGVDEDTITAAPNRAALVELIGSTPTTPQES